jgi:hypothetical protein
MKDKLIKLEKPFIKQKRAKELDKDMDNALSEDRRIVSNIGIWKEMDKIVKTVELYTRGTNFIVMFTGKSSKELDAAVYRHLIAMNCSDRTEHAMTLMRIFDLDFEIDQEKIGEMLELVNEYEEVVEGIVAKFYGIEERMNFKPEIQRICKTTFEFPVWLSILYIEMLKTSYGEMFEKRCSRMLELDIKKNEDFSEICITKASKERDLREICEYDKYMKQVEHTKIIIREIEEKSSETHKKNYTENKNDPEVEVLEWILVVP